MKPKAEKILHVIGEVKHKISLLEGYLEYLEKELEKEVNSEVEK